MKKAITSSILLAAAMSASAAPLVTVGDQLDLFFKGAVIGKWDSNITYTGNPDIKKNDYSAIFRLGAEADYGRNSKFKANVKFYEDLTRYADYKEFNSNLAHVAANASYTESAWSVKANFSFDQNYQNSATTEMANQTGQLVRFNDWRAGAMASYDFTEKLFAELGGDWTYRQYLGDWSRSYSDYNVYSVPVSLLYRVTPKVSVGLTYQYRYTEFEGGSDWAKSLGNRRNDHFAGVTVRGDILPKLNLSAFVGATYRDMNGIYDTSDTTVSCSVTANYELTEKIGLFVTGRRDFGNGASRQSSIDTGCEAGANYLLNQFVSFTTSFAYVNSDYEDMNRNDDEYVARFGVNYKPNKFLTLGANYRFLENSSNVAYASYNQHLVDISVAVKY
mgnify:CR=1 FL=1